MNKNLKPFPITALCRDDVARALNLTAEQAAMIDDDYMKIIAAKMADDYCEQLFWGSLKIIAENILGNSKDWAICSSCGTILAVNDDCYTEYITNKPLCGNCSVYDEETESYRRREGGIKNENR